MSDKSTFTIELDAELRAAFTAAAEASNRTAAHVLREMMIAFVQEQIDTPAYEVFLHEKVARSRVSMRAGHGRPSDDVDADFAARRAATRAAGQM